MVAPRGEADAVYLKWSSWLDRLKVEVIALHHHRDVWRAMNEALGRSSGGETFLDHYAWCYVAAASTAIRRLSDPNPGQESITIARLIKDVRAQRHIITRERYVRLFDSPDVLEDIRSGASSEFDRNWGDASGLVRPDFLSNLESRIEEHSARVAAFVDRTIAHIDKRGVAMPPTFGDLDEAIDTVGLVLRACLLLITAENWVSMTPTIQDDWRAPFRSAIFR
jgi:hypothetical protein